MALSRATKEFIPKDAVVITEDEALTYQWKIISNWEKLSDVCVIFLELDSLVYKNCAYIFLLDGLSVTVQSYWRLLRLAQVFS